MISTPGPNYSTPYLSDVKEKFQEIAKFDKKNSQKLKDLCKKEKEMQFIRHCSDRLSGGSTMLEKHEIGDPESIEKQELLTYIDPINLNETDSSSYIDYASYIMYRNAMNENDKQQGNGKSPKDLAKSINEDMKTIGEDLAKGDISDNEENGSNSDRNDPNLNSKEPGKHDSGKHKSRIEKIMEIHDKKLYDITYLISRVMTKFIPEIGEDVTTLREDANGSERFSRQMKSYSELSRINPTNLVQPEDVVLEKLSKKGYQIPVRASGSMKKQFIHVLADCSGSMSSSCNISPFDKFSRVDVVRAIVKNLLKRVEKEDSLIFFQMYDSSIHSLIKAYDKISIDLMIKYLDTQYGAHGSTNTQEALESVINTISKMDMSNTRKPEILLITDGDDWVDIKTDLKKIKLNYINVAKEKSSSMYDLCDNFIEL